MRVLDCGSFGWFALSIAAAVALVACAQVAGLGDFVDVSSSGTGAGATGGHGGGTGGGTGGAGAQGGGSGCNSTTCSGSVGDCSLQACVDGVCTLVHESEGEPCGAADEDVCDGQGACVECNIAADCIGDDICVDHTCFSSTCEDNQLSTGETDIDCGGPCPPCDVEETCALWSDCTTGYCTDPGLQCEAHSSCAELVTAVGYGIILDGVYLIDPDGGGTGQPPFSAYCDMTNYGGGWTLVMKLSSAGPLLYGHTAWEGISVLLNETDLQPNTGAPGTSAKLEAFNHVKGIDLMLQWLAPVHRFTHSFFPAETARTVFATGTTVKKGDGNTTQCQEEVFVGSSDWNANEMRHGKGRQIYGLNIDYSGHGKMRWGFGSDNDANMPYKSQHAIGTEDFELKWHGQPSCSGGCGCYGANSYVIITPTAANLWIR